MAYSFESEKTLVVYNPNSRNGESILDAATVARTLNCDAISFQEAIQQGVKTLEHTCRDKTLLLMLTGDGSFFSMAWMLSLCKGEVARTLVPFAFGGENVAAKNANVPRSLEEKIRCVQLGAFSVQPMEPLSLQTKSAQRGFFWGVHSGFTTHVLKHIESMRKVQTKDWIRRYYAGGKSVRDMDEYSPVSFALNSNPYHEVQDVGVISSLFPYWTAKMQFSVQDVPALLHVVESLKNADMPITEYKLRFMMEIAVLSAGLRSIPLKLIKHKRLLHSDSISIHTHSGAVSIDSELQETDFAQIKLVAPVGKKARVNSARFE